MRELNSSLSPYEKWIEAELLRFKVLDFIRSKKGYIPERFRCWDPEIIQALSIQDDIRAFQALQVLNHFKNYIIPFALHDALVPHRNEYSRHLKLLQKLSKSKTKELRKVIGVKNTATIRGYLDGYVGFCKSQTRNNYHKLANYMIDKIFPVIEPLNAQSHRQ